MPSRSFWFSRKSGFTWKHKSGKHKTGKYNPWKHKFGTKTPDIKSISDDTGISATDFITNDDMIELSGTAQPRAKIYVYIDGVKAGTARADYKGKWTFTADALDDGQYDLRVAARKSGKTKWSKIKAATVDTQIGDPTIDEFSEDTGTVGDGITSENILTLIGTTEAGATVEVFDGTQLLGTAVADEAGAWSFLTDELADGTHSFSAVATDIAGNVSEPSEALDVTVDTTPAPALAITGYSDDTGTADDGITADNDLTLTGTALPGATVQIFDGGTLLADTTADELGNWSFATGLLAEGAHSFTAVDGDGNPSAALDVTVDTLTPAAPVIVSYADDTDPVGDGTTSDNDLILTGTAEAGAMVEIFDGGTSLGTVVADTDGDWSFATGLLADGTHSFAAVATDSAGNVSEASAALDVIVDTTPAPALAITGYGDDTGASGDGITSDNDLTLTGTAEPGATVEIFDGGTSLGTAGAGEDGDWSFATGPLTDGAHSFTAADTASGDTSTAVDVTIDTMPPPDPFIADYSDDTGAPGDGITADNTLSLSGVTEPDASVEIFDGSVSLGTTTADEDGNWFFETDALAEGAHGFRVAATDVAGNPSDISPPFDVTVDTTAPAAPAIVDYADDTGTIGDGITSDNDLTLTGTAEPDVTVEIFDGGTSLGTAVADSAGAWSFVTGTLADGAHSFTAVATDAAGNPSPESASLDVTIDPNADPLLVVTTLEDETYDSGTFADELADGGGLSLREAIGLANAGIGDDGGDGLIDITFDESLVERQIDIDGELTISADMEIDGGAAGITIAADGSNRVLDITGNATNASLNALTITGGSDGGNGGGVQIRNGADVSISNSAIIDNYAGSYGGAMHVGSGTTATITNTTVSGNSGGIFDDAITVVGEAELVNSTVTGNDVGIFNAIGGDLTLTNSIVLGNTTGDLNDFATLPVTYSGLNIVGTGAGSDPNVIGANAEEVFADIDPVTGGGLLADNGGPTQTIALLDDASNPAIDAAIGGTDTDQRGQAAHDAIAGTGDTENNRDIGAYELQPLANAAPSGADNTVATNEDTGYVFTTADFGFTDADGDNFLGVNITTLPSGGALSNGSVPVGPGEFISVADIAAGNLAFGPDPDANGTGYANFTFQVQDDAGGVDPTPKTLTIDVTPVNDAPVVGTTIGDQSATQGTLFSFTVPSGAFTDVDDNDILTLSATGPGWLVFDAGSGTFTGTPGALDVGPFAVTVTATDLSNESVSQPFTITVDAAGNNAPVLGGTDISTSLVYTENDGATPIAATITVDDADLDTIQSATVALAGFVATEDVLDFVNPFTAIDATLSAGVLTLSGPATVAEYEQVLGSLTYQNISENPSAAVRALSITVNDGTDDSNTVMRDIIVTPVDDPPMGQPVITPAAPVEDTVLTAGTSFIDDADGLGPFSYQWESSNGTVWNTITGATASTFAPGDDQVGQMLRVSVSYTDGGGKLETVTSDATTAVTNINDDPVARDDMAFTFEGTPFSGDLFDDNGLGPDSDADGDNFTVTEVNGVATNVGTQFTLDSGALLQVNPNGSFDYDPNGAFDSLDTGDSAVDNFTYTIDDGNSGTATANVTMTINGVNDAPEALSILGTTIDSGEAGAIVGTLSAIDADGEPLSYTVTDPSSDFEVDGTTLKLKDGVALTSSANNTAATSVALQVSDGTETTAKTVNVTVVDTTATSFTAASAGSTSRAKALDLNADGFTDLALRGSSVVSFGSATGLQASSESAIDGSNGFIVNADADALGGGDLNGDGIDDLAIGTVADQSVYVVFGDSSWAAANVDATALNGTDGFAVTGLVADIGGGTGTINLDVGDVNGDALDDLIINEVLTDVTGTETVSTTYAVYGSDTGFAPIIDVSGLDGTNGFTLTNIADAVSGGSLAVADVDGDEVDDIIVGAPDASGAAGKVYVVKGKQGFAANTDVASLAADEMILISAAAAATLGTTVSAVGDVNDDGIEDLATTDANGDAYVLDGAMLQAAETVSLAAADVTFTGVSGELSKAGDVSGDGVEDLFAEDASGNSFVLHGRADLQGAAPAELVDAAEADGFVIAGTQARPIPLGDADGDGFADFMVVNPGNLSLASGADFGGEATFVGGDGDDMFTAGAPNDVLIGGRGNDNLSGGDGNDHILGGAGVDTLNGDAGDDGVEGGEGNDQVSGGDGNDVLLGQQGIDTLNGDAGNDRLEGGPGGDNLLGGLGDDLLFGGGGDDMLQGGDMNDLLMGDAGNDQLFGDDGNDVLAGGPGMDSLTGGLGDDRFVFHIGDGPVTITDYAGGAPGQTLDVIEFVGFIDLDFATLDTNQDQELTPMDGPNILPAPGGGLTLLFGPNDALTVQGAPALFADDLLFS